MRASTCQLYINATASQFPRLRIGGERLDNEFASILQAFVSQINTESVKMWTDSFSHPEVLRSGFNQDLKIDPNDWKILFQGTASETMADKNYGRIPWRLGLLTLDRDARRPSKSDTPDQR